MTNKERVSAALRHRQPDRIPYNVRFTSRARQTVVGDGARMVRCLLFRLSWVVAAVTAADEVKTSPPLPQGAYAEWDLAKAWRETSATRERICLNGFWRFRSAATALPEPQVVLNEGFETAVTERLVCGEGVPGWRAERDTAVKHTGAAAMRLSFDLAAGVPFWHFRLANIPVKPNTACRLTAQLQHRFTEGAVYFGVHDSRGYKHFCLNSRPFGGSSGGQWQPLTLDFTTPADGASVALVLQHNADSALSGELWLDDVRITQERPFDPTAVSPPNDPNWGFLKVPGAWSAAGFTPFWHRDDPLAGKGGALGQAWYEREVTVPLEWQGRRIGIHAEKVATDAHVYCDGHFAGTIGYAGGGVDITPWAKPGVKVRVSALVLTRRPAEILAEFGVPASGDTGPETRGLVGDVYLTSEPPRGPHVGPFQIMTTVKNQEIRVRTNLEITDSDVTGLAVVCQVKDGPRTVKTFSAPLPNGAAIAEPSTAWPDAELWDIGHPKLYTLTVSIRRGEQVLDESLPERFGFREFEIRGKFFYLNGVKINLRPSIFFTRDHLAWASRDAVDRWLDKTLAAGYNFSYLETEAWPGKADQARTFLKAADERGLLVAITPPQINRYWERWSQEPKTQTAWTALTQACIQQYWNHPSLVLWRMNMNFCGYNQDQNPLCLDGAMPPAPDSRLGKQFAAAAKSSEIMHGIDPTRSTYHHASGNAGDIYTLNNYLCWPVPQDLREWLHVWAERGAKPLMMVEFDLPYPGSFGLNDPNTWHCGTPLMTEYGAILLGEKSYQMEDDDYLDFVARSWDATARKWRSNYSYYSCAFPRTIDECSRLYHEIVYPAWRTWGISGGMNSWENTPRRLKMRATTPTPGWERKTPPNVALPTGWATLQQPGYSPDIFVYPGNTQMCLFDPGRPEEQEYLEPTRRGEVMPVLNQPLFAWIAGPGADWPEQDHGFYAGETVRKSVVVINDLRTAATFRVAWRATLDGRELTAATAEVTVAPAEKVQVPVEFALPSVQTRLAGQVTATVAVAGKTVPVSAFSFQVHPRPAPPPVATDGWGIYDPKGRTAKALAAWGVKLTPVPADSLPAGLRVLVIGSEALDAAGEPPAFLTQFPECLAAGLQVVLFEQTGAALDRFFGMRTATRATRQVWRRDPAHAFVAGVENEDLADWRGRTTLAPPDGPPASLDESQRWKCVWRCSQRGTVASVIVEKPHIGAFRPILDCEFDLRYMALWESFEGQGRFVFCQLDVSDRIGTDPAVTRIVANLLADVGQWQPRPAASTALGVGPEGLSHFLPFKLDAVLNPVELSVGTVLVLSRGCATWLFAHRAALERFLAEGGRVVAAGLTLEEGQVLAHVTGTRFAVDERTLARTPLDSAALPAPFRGVGPAELHWREARAWPCVTTAPAGGWRTDTGILATIPIGKGELVWVSAMSADFDPARRPDLVFSQANASRLLALTLSNCGVRNGPLWSARLAPAMFPEPIALPEVWRVRKDPDAVGARDGWMKPEMDETSADWCDMRVPGLWGEMYKDWYGFLGDVWYRVRFSAPESCRGLPLEVFATAIDDTDECWLNGQKIGETTRGTPDWWSAERHYRIRQELVRFGPDAANVLVFRVNNNYMDAGFVGTVRIGVPERLLRRDNEIYLDTRVPRDNPYAYMRW